MELILLQVITLMTIGAHCCLRCGVGKEAAEVVLHFLPLVSCTIVKIKHDFVHAEDLTRAVLENNVKRQRLLTRTKLVAGSQFP